MFPVASPPATVASVGTHAHPLCRAAKESSTPATISITPSTPSGNARHNGSNADPNNTASNTFAVPRNSSDPFVLAPNRYCPANPPAP